MARLLFRMLPQVGHHNSTFKLAEEFKGKGHEVIYAANKKFEGIIRKNGFDFIEIPEEEDIGVYNAVRKEPFIVKARRFTGGFMRSQIKSNERIWNMYSKDYFSHIIKNVQPDIIFIDSILKAYSLQIKKYKIPFVTVQTTVSNLKLHNIPPYDSLFIPKNSLLSPVISNLMWKFYVLRRIDKRPHLKIFQKLLDHFDFPQNEIDRKNYHDFGFRSVIEINTSPYEFDFPHKLNANYFHYSNTALYQRSESTVEYNFEKVYEVLKHKERKIIFCSFGSLSWRYPNHNKLISKIVQLFNTSLKKYTLILCIDDYNLRRKLRKSCSDNIFIFKRVPQIKVLENLADVMINHGGLNSIIECIYTNTPMLVYPGSRLYDQFGNAARVKYHKIGQAGNSKEGIKTIKERIVDLAENQVYKENLFTMKKAIDTNIAYKNIEDIIQRIMDNNKTKKNEALVNQAVH